MMPRHVGGGGAFPPACASQNRVRIPNARPWVPGSKQEDIPGHCKGSHASVCAGDHVPELKGVPLDAIPPGTDLALPISTLCVFVDPVDGTREFVEGRLQAVQTLVGVAYMGRSIAGAVGIPFPEGKLTNPPSVVYALVGAGVGRTGFQPPAYKEEKLGGWSATTGDSIKCKVINAAVRVTEPPRRVILGAAGNKILSLSRGNADVALLNTGTCKWDTCAPEAVLRAMGGTLTVPIATLIITPRCMHA